jgi:branched-chain amino acid transport system substrate-binding protein
MTPGRPARLPLLAPSGMIPATKSRPQEMRHVPREASMKRLFSGVFASVLAVAATAAFAQGKPPLKLGGILDMSGLYADITGPGSEMAAKMAAEDFGGEVLGRKIEIIAADHLNKADLAANIARRHARQPGRRNDL